MMQTTGADYYDLPDDQLPSANFAARPTSDISDLGLLDIDALWTFMTSEGEVDFDDGPTPTALTPETALMPQPEMPGTPPDTPAIKVVSPSRRQSLRQSLKRLSDVAAIVRKPSMRQKAGTAPPGAFDSPDYAPQVPRRAMSARLSKRVQAAERYSRNLSSASDLKITVMEDRVLEETPSQHILTQDSDERRKSGLLQPNGSFSRKPRVQETLERKKLSRLRMDFVATEPSNLVESPQSMLGTPEELYAAPQVNLQPGRFRPTSAIHGRRGTSTPVSPKTPSPFAAPQSWSNNCLAADEDLGDLYQTTTYAPGPIRLENESAVLRSKSVATLDPFASEMESIGRRPSDLVTLEQIVMCFDGMGLSQAATDECLDRYWLQTALHETELDIFEPESATPTGQHSSRSRDAHSTLSRFSFSSASSGASVQQGTPQKRQLVRLRRLLSPALPGLKGAEGEQQTRGS